MVKIIRAKVFKVPTYTGVIYLRAESFEKALEKAAKVNSNLRGPAELVWEEDKVQHVGT